MTLLIFEGSWYITKRYTQSSNIDQSTVELIKN